MGTPSKNIKISKKHHEILKAYCEKTGLKMYRVIEKWIETLDKMPNRSKKKDLYDE